MWFESGYRGWVAAGAAVLLLAGCAEEALGPSGDITAEAAEAVATFLVDVDGTAGWTESVAAEVVSGTRGFSRSAPCPAGGERGVSGSGNSSFDQETRILTLAWSTTQTHDECAFERGRRGNTVLTVIDGSVTAQGTAKYQLPEDRRRPRTLLEYEATRVGTVTTTVGERTKTCEIDVKESYDPRTGTFEVTGTVCGRRVNVMRSPGARRDGQP